jgi:hypothetical protein
MDTIYACSKILLTHFPHEERQIPDDPEFPDRNESVVAAMNAALEECYGQGSPWMRQDDRGDLLRAPATVTISVTEGSRTGEITTGWQDWMAGCSIVIDGHDIDNQIRDDNADCTLKYPYGGTTGSKTATVYHDCITVTSDVLTILEPVRVDGRRIHPLANGQSVRSPYHVRDYGMHHQIYAEPNIEALRLSALAGFVRAFSVETYAPDEAMNTVLRIRLHGTVNASATFAYAAKLKAPRITSASSLEAPPVPHDFVASIFLPVARQKLTASPFFRDQAGREEISAAYAEAKKTLEAINPKTPRTFRFQP